MFSRITKKEKFSFRQLPTVEKRLVVENIDGENLLVAIDFDTTELDLGTADLYDLDSMLKAGVKPGVAVPHDSSPIDALNMSNEFVDSFINESNNG